MQSTTTKLYWPGNAAKTRIIAKILEALPGDKDVIVFDYGCGDGGDWPSVIRDNPGIKLFGYEPYPPSYQKAQARLKGTGAVLISGDDIKSFSLAADFIVSFSVLEHVYDRRAYLAKAKSLLGPGGQFYLNYDDGHFRNLLDLGHPWNWREVLREWKLNRSASRKAFFKNLSFYQKRVTAAEADELIAATGFRVLETRYDNLLAFKNLAKTIPSDRMDAFVRFWLEAEERLNADFQVQGELFLGDKANIWKEMVSRTLLLTHR